MSLIGECSLLNGINHLTFAVSDLPRSFQFYHEVLQMKALARWKTGAYLLCGELWICLSLDPHTRTTPMADYSHTAFHVHPEQFSDAADRIVKSGAVIWKQNSSEGDSLYFLDPDHHKLELHTTTWRDRIAATKRAPYAEMEFFD